MVIATHEGITWAIEQVMQGEMPIRKVDKPSAAKYPVARMELFDSSSEGWVFVAEIVPGSIKFYERGDTDGRSL